MVDTACGPVFASTYVVGETIFPFFSLSVFRQNLHVLNNSSAYRPQYHGGKVDLERIRRV